MVDFQIAFELYVCKLTINSVVSCYHILLTISYPGDIGATETVGATGTTGIVWDAGATGTVRAAGTTWTVWADGATGIVGATETSGTVGLS